MDRRDVFKSVVAVGAGFFGVAFRSKAEAAAQSGAIPKVAYHLSDVDKAAFVLANIRNHFDGMGGPGNVQIALVVHGPALRAFRADAKNDAITSVFDGLQKDGVAYHACGNTMKGMKLALADLLPGFEVAERGGVVKLAELQAAGWLYLRP
jgi:intracellular sulfur oxidation DsrE/DsrF family protein